MKKRSKHSAAKSKISFALAIVLILSLASCGTKKNFYGTWEAVSVEVNGSTFTMDEIEAMGDDSLKNFTIVIKEGGKAYASVADESEVIDWEETDSGIKIGTREFKFNEDLLITEINGNSIAFEKVSDSQEIKKTAQEENKTDIEKQTQTPAPSLDISKSGDSSFSDLENAIEKTVEDAIFDLNSKYATLMETIDSYENYLQNVEKVEMFYSEAYNTMKTLGVKMREYSVNYAEAVISSDKANDDKYDDLDGIYDCIYDDAGDDIYDGIYDDLFDELYDAFYDGILDDAYDTVPYKEWSKVHSGEYERWSDTHSDIYEEWSDYRSDIYEFWSDMRSAFWSDDIEEAKEVIEDLKKDIEKLKADDVKSSSALGSEAQTETTNSNPSVEDEANLRTDFKDAMDSYEAFYDEYCSFMEKYAENPSDLTLLMQYTEILEKMEDMDEKFEAWGDSDLSSEELSYYLEVNARIAQKLIELI